VTLRHRRPRAWASAPSFSGSVACIDAGVLARIYARVSRLFTTRTTAWEPWEAASASITAWKTREAPIAGEVDAAIAAWEAREAAVAGEVDAAIAITTREAAGTFTACTGEVGETTAAAFTCFGSAWSTRSTSATFTSLGEWSAGTTATFAARASGSV
jgi:hypothetical protein